MILTRKIEVYVYQANSETRREHIRKLYEWRHLVLNGANEVLSYLYSIDRLKYYKFLTEKTKLEIGIAIVAICAEIPRPRLSASLPVPDGSWMAF